MLKGQNTQVLREQNCLIEIVRNVEADDPSNIVYNHLTTSNKK
ncbi:MAG: hypothetical protein CM15mV90_150 [uncultured marine virus]|nr:MAG: hypothetical protein CM15mV90_150 [uncultured marine virus]